MTVAGNVKKIGGGERHLSLSVQHHEVKLRAIAFGQSDWAEDLEEAREAKTPIDVAFHPVLNEFNGRRSVELQLVDWRPSGRKDEMPRSTDQKAEAVESVDVPDLPF